jgi:glucose/arabinose dehydrogenase
VRRTGALFLVTIKENLATVHSTASVDVTRIANFNSLLCFEGGRGLLHAIFHPDYKTNGYIYITFTFKDNTSCGESLETGPRNRCSRFIFRNGLVDMSSELVLFQTDRHEKTTHSGGNMAFGKDGFLYVAMGDGGTKSTGQTLGDLKSSIIRLTTDGGVPGDNPFVSNNKSVRCNTFGVAPPGSPPDAVCQEVFAYGFRNPFKMAMDPNAANVRFFVGDVGDVLYEEISEGGAAFPGANYGWSNREGPCDGNGLNCKVDPLSRDPVYWYSHPTTVAQQGGAIVGGAFCERGKWPAEYDSVYFYGDYVYGKIYTLHQNTSAGCRDCVPPRPSFTNKTFLESPEVIDMRFAPFRGGGRALYYMNRQGTLMSDVSSMSEG